jgi:hypothetical protein
LVYDEIVARPCIPIALLLGGIVVACGRVGFDVELDAGVLTDAANAEPRLVAGSALLGSGTQLVVPISTVTPGDLVLAAVTEIDNTAVSAVHDDHGVMFARAGSRALLGGTATEIWFVDATAASTSVTVEMAKSSIGFDIFVAEVANVASGPPIATATGCLEYPPTIAHASVDAPAGTFVFGSTMLQNPLYVDAADPPFTALPIVSGNGAAYWIASADGSAGPTWTLASGSGMMAATCSSTLAFAPLP